MAKKFVVVQIPPSQSDDVPLQECDTSTWKHIAEYGGFLKARQVAIKNNSAKIKDQFYCVVEVKDGVYRVLDPHGYYLE